MRASMVSAAACQVVADESEFLAAVASWTPAVASKVAPVVAVDPWPGGWRVRVSYLGVESGVVFTRTGPGSRGRIHETLDRIYEILSWRVIRAPSRTNPG